jgi:hypothetical protein
VVQETYVRAFANLAQFRGESSLSAWLARIALNDALERRRHERRVVDVEKLDIHRPQAQVIPFPQSASSTDPEKTMAQRQILQLVEQITDRLPEIFRVVFVARMIEGMSVEEKGAPRNSARNCKNAIAPGATHDARADRQADRAGLDGRLSVCGQALRADVQRGNATARSPRLSCETTQRTR